MTESDLIALRAWLDLLTTSNAVKKSVDTTLRSQFGVSISRFDVLSTLERAEPDGLRAGDLSQRLMVTEGNTTQVTAPLIRDGLVKRTSSAEDRRVAIFRLTRKGAKLFEKMAGEHRRWIGAAFGGLSQNDMETLRLILAKIDLRLDNEEKDAA